MSVWEQLLIAFGGNAMLLVVLGFLARSLLQTWLTKDIKKFEADLKTTADSELERLKADLKAKGDVSIEELKSSLQQAAFEHQVRFSNLHEKRAEIIAELYSRAVELHLIGGRFVFQIGGKEHEEQYREADRAMFAFYEFFAKHPIYLPERICSMLSDFDDTVRRPVSGFYVYGGLKLDSGLPPNVRIAAERKDALMAAYQAFQSGIPEALKALEDEFRAMLGSERSR